MCDKYTIKKKLGQGTFGTVYLAEANDGSNTKVAIKTGIDELCNITPTELIGETNLSSGNIRFFEYDILCRINHPNVSRANDLISPGAFSSCIPNSGSAVVLELAEMDLEEYINKRINDVPLEQMFLQMAIGIQALHKAGYYHLDIKPANYLVYRDNTTNKPIFKVSDFGFCVDKSVKNMEYIRGTPLFFAPESDTTYLFTGKEDVYSLGVSFLRIMFSYIDFSFDEIVKFADFTTLPKIYNGFYRTLYTKVILKNSDNPIIAKLLSQDQQILLRTLSRDPETRPSIEELVSYLSSVSNYTSRSLIFIQEPIRPINSSIISETNFKYIKNYFLRFYSTSTARMFFHCLDLINKLYNKTNYNGSFGLALLACNLISRDIHMFDALKKDYAGYVFKTTDQYELKDIRSQVCGLTKLIMDSPDISTQLNSPIPFDMVDKNDKYLIKGMLNYEKWLKSYRNLNGKFISRVENGVTDTLSDINSLIEHEDILTITSNLLQQPEYQNSDFMDWTANKPQLIDTDNAPANNEDEYAMDWAPANNEDEYAMDWAPAAANR